jgi:hypothetical protein
LPRIVYCKELQNCIQKYNSRFWYICEKLRTVAEVSLKILTRVTYCSVTSHLSDILTFNHVVIKVRYEVYLSSYQHSSILREWHFIVKNKSVNFSAPTVGLNDQFIYTFCPNPDVVYNLVSFEQEIRYKLLFFQEANWYQTWAILLLVTSFFSILVSLKSHFVENLEILLVFIRFQSPHGESSAMVLPM